MRIGLCGLAAIVISSAGCGSGSACSVTENADGSATITCEDGTEATVRGGMDGAGCTVSDDGMGARVIECDDGTVVTVPGGMDGMDGDPGGDGRDALVAGPGLTLEVRESGVTADATPYVVLRLTDAEGRPLDREGRFTEGAVSASFTIAHLPVETRVDGDVVLPYASYLTRTVTSAEGPETAEQPTTDADGAWSAIDAADGIYRYDFGTPLPAGYPAGETHTIGIYATRSVDGVRYVANATPSFRPDGMAVTVTREIVSNAACNGCHSPLSAHGGSREDVTLCATCHGTGFADPESGNTIDFRTMIHRIHRGASLPSVENGVSYEIVGFRGSVHDYSEVHFPRDIRGCETCHQGGADADRWNTVPSRAACGSCHDDIWFEPGAPPEPWMRLHPGGDRPTDDRCTVCHEPTGGLAPVIDSHFTRLQAPDALSVDFVLDAVRINGAGTPEIDFTVTVDGTGRDIIASPLPRFSFTLAGPTTDYRFFASYSPSSVGSLTALGGAGQFRYELPDTVAEVAMANGVPAEGTWAIGVEGYERSASGETYSGPNRIAYLPVTDTTAVPRREVVEVTRCNTCHEELRMHGGPRSDPMYCAMCHNGNTDTIGRMPLPVPGDTAETASVSFARMIHRVHTGHDGESDYTLWSFSGSPVTFDELHYPADRRDCARCHVSEESHDLPLSDVVIPARTRRVDAAGGVISTFLLPPETSACVGCHDSPASFAHAETMTAAMGAEACATCHGSGSAFGVEEVHARPEYAFRP